MDNHLEEVIQDAVGWHRRFQQQARWTAELRHRLFTRAGIDNARRVLEVGCGSGAVLQEIQFAQPRLPKFPNITLRSGQELRKSMSRSSQHSGSAHGLDLSIEYLSLAQRHAPQASLAQGDGQRLPFASASFDIVFCHFLLLWVADPQAVVDEMVRVALPGGAVLLLAEPDYGGRIDYPDEFRALGRLQEEALRRQGAETRLGRRLRALLHRAGLQQIESGVLSGQWQAAPDSREIESEWAVLQADLADQVSPDELARLRKLDEQAWWSGERTLFVPTFYGWGRKADPKE